MVDKSSIKQGEQAVTNTGDEDADPYGRYDTLLDVVGTDIENQVTLLQNLGIVSGYADGTFKPEDTITRAEFAVMICNITADVVWENNQKAIFDDVPKEHWANKYVEYLYGNNMVTGISENFFGPDNEITIQQAAKIIVSMLGKDIFAEDIGGYPNGYMQIAHDEGLLKNITKKSDLVAMRGEVAVMLYQCS